MSVTIDKSTIISGTITCHLLHITTKKVLFEISCELYNFILKIKEIRQILRFHNLHRAQRNYKKIIDWCIQFQYLKGINFCEH